MASKTRGDELPSMGVLSVGRGNDFAYGADIPAGLAACVDILVDGLVRPMDVGLVTGGDYPGGRHFGNGVGIGFDTIVGLEAAKMKRVHGFMSYVLGAVKTFAAFPEAPAVRVAFDGGAVEQRSHQISIMNGRRMGGTFFMAPRAVNHDGLLDLCMAERLNRREMVGLIIRYTKGSQAGHPKIRMERSRRIEISAPEGGLVVHADGETICIDGRSIVAECLPSQIGIRCLPAPEAP
jgi:diacylglycerol kinase (ATP)